MLAPKLRPGDIVIMDNLAAHKVAGIREAIEAAGRRAALPAALLPRPQPDRAGLRQAQGAPAQGRRRTVDGLWNAIGKLLDCFPPAECANYLANSGYPRSA